MNKQQGFSLLELMLVLVIIGVLAAIAIPSYAGYKVSSNRTAIKADLSRLVSLLERRYTENGFYTTTRTSNTCIELDNTLNPPYFDEGPSGTRVPMYDIAFWPNAASCTVSTYTLRATPRAGTSQAADGFLEITSAGVKRWDKNNNGLVEAAERYW